MDLVIPAGNALLLREIASWDGFRPATFAASDFPVDVVRFDGSSSPPVALSRARRAETLKALPATLRERAAAAFEKAGRIPRSLRLARGKTLSLEDGPAVVGIVNVTPDSFSDGGLHFEPAAAVDRALRMLEEGAAMVDVGGESTRPSTYGPAEEIPAEEEIRRVVPVIEGIRKSSEAPISVDTRRSQVAGRALEAGADAVNDISALRFDPAMAETVAAAGAALILMHMKGDDPRTMQQDVSYKHLLADVSRELAAAVERALAAGIAPDAIAVDPGLGFGKSAEGNLAILRHLEAFRSLGRPVMIGASRKKFVRVFSGVPDDAPVADRLPGSLACAAAAERAGAALVRVHDAGETVRFLRMSRAIRVPAA
ncbi:MAG TPA: dihydropteroate synthase [Thermoanaerobaculia bacterium]|nr:dihydropteroate synthase [Thermoanaerobaculia bacterium]